MLVLVSIIAGLSVVLLLVSAYLWLSVRYGMGAYPPGIGEWQQNTIDGFVNKAMNKQKWMDEWVRHYDRRISELERKAGIQGEPTPYPIQEPDPKTHISVSETGGGHA